MDLDELNIPRIIHLTYKDHNIPKVWQNTISSWKKYHPNWEIKFWSDVDNRQLIKHKYNWFLKTYDSYEYGIQRADAIRYFILYTYGGIYSDMDIEPIKNFDKIFQKISDKNVYLIRTPQMSYVTNCFMASKPGSKFWLDVFKIMKRDSDNPSYLWIGKHWKVMNTTGPLMLNRIYEAYQNKDEISFLPSEYILPTKCNICSNKPCSTKKGYTKLLEGSSWINFDTKIYNCFLCNFSLIVSLLIAIILIICKVLICSK